MPAAELAFSPPVQRALVDVVGVGDTQIVAAQGAGKIIRVNAVVAIGTTGVNLRFKSGATNISPAFPFGANGGFVIPFEAQGWFETAANEALNVNLSLAVATGVHVLYQVIG